MIAYRKATLNTTAPSSPALGEMWIKPLTSTSYQVYFWINEWLPIIGGGTFLTESSPDDHYFNVIIQEDTPTDIIRPGWFWIKESVSQAYLYIFDFMPLVGA